MKRIVIFDSYGSSSEVSLEAARARSIPGVKSVDVLEAMEGSPRYCLIVETDDDQDKTVEDRLQNLAMQYTQYISNISTRTYRKIG